MKLSFSSLLSLSSVAFAAPNGWWHGQHDEPAVTVRNGTYTGVYSSSYKQDFFLGIPYSQPPVGDLRFRNPQSLNSSWQTSRKADTYSPACVGYGVSQRVYYCFVSPLKM